MFDLKSAGFPAGRDFGSLGSADGARSTRNRRVVEGGGCHGFVVETVLA
jgi:hypothetical protein